MIELKGKSDKFIAGFAVRTKSLEVLKHGLDGLFESNAIADYRDVISALVLYYDAARRLTSDPDEFLLEYARDQSESMRSHITSFVSRAPENKTVSVGGYVVENEPEFHYRLNMEI